MVLNLYLKKIYIIKLYFLPVIEIKCLWYSYSERPIHKVRLPEKLCYFYLESFLAAIKTVFFHLRQYSFLEGAGNNFEDPKKIRRRRSRACQSASNVGQ